MIFAAVNLLLAWEKTDQNRFYWGPVLILVARTSLIDKINYKNHGLLPPGSLVSPPGGFASLVFDQAIPKNSKGHLADRNAI